MAFNPFNLFKGNPKVLEFMNKNSQLEVLLMEEAFVSEFKRSENETLQNYMNYQKYEQLVQYITTVDQNKVADPNRSYRFPFVSAQILAVNNETTFKYLLEEVVFTEEEIEEEVEVEKEIDSDRSYSSIKSNNSSRSSREVKSFQEEDKENFVLKNADDRVLDDFLSQEKEINEDDFPDVPQKKVIMVEKTGEKRVKVPFEPLVFKILKYFQSPDVIHILDGYLSKVLENIVQNRFQTLIAIVEKYNRFDQITNLFSHIDSSSVQDLLITLVNRMIEAEGVTPVSDQTSLLKIIQARCLEHTSVWASAKLTSEDRQYFLNLYYLFIEKITLKLRDKVTDNAVPNIDKELLLIESIANYKIVEPLTSILGELVFGHEKKVEYSRLILAYLKIVRVILSSFLTVRQYKQHQKLQKKQKTTIQGIIQNCEDSFDCMVNLGFTFIFEDFLLAEGQEGSRFRPQNSIASKLEFLEIIGKLTEENIYFSRKTVIDNPFFEHLLQLMNLYPQSSIFHNGILKLILPFLNGENDVSTVNKFFQKKKLFHCIYNIVKADLQNRYQLKKSRCCYIAQVISICMAIQKLGAEDSEDLSTFRQSEEWQYIHECLLLEEKGLREQILGGLEKQGERKPIIFFTKKDCLNHFRYFLSGIKYSSFQQFQNYEPGNSDSEEEVDHTLKYLMEEGDIVKEEQMEEMLGDDKYFDQNIDL